MLRAAVVMALLVAPTAGAAGPAGELPAAFDGMSGCFLLYDEVQGKVLERRGGDACAERRAPCSTFKIPNALIGLETGAVESETTVFRWDGTARRIAAWNRDHELASAMRDSVVWYFQEIARRVGRERMQQFVDAIGYGNRDTSGGLTEFWLGSSLMISADEQLAFLRRLYAGDLPFSARNLAIVRRILVQPDEGGVVFSGKTGSCESASGSHGWFVGRVERGSERHLFVVEIVAPQGADGRRARTIAKKLLDERGLLAPAPAPPQRGGHGHDATVRHAFTDVARYSAAWDDPARDAWQRPDAVLAFLALKPGATVADLGAGTGYFTVRLARAVAPKGRVLAVDVEPAMLEHVRGRAKKEALPEIETVLAEACDPHLPAGAVDLILTVNTWHHIDDRVRYLDHLATALRPGGRLVIVDYREGDLPVGPPAGSKLSREAVIDELAEGGFELDAELDALPYQYALAFTRR